MHPRFHNNENKDNLDNNRIIESGFKSFMEIKEVPEYGTNLETYKVQMTSTYLSEGLESKKST